MTTTTTMMTMKMIMSGMTTTDRKWKCLQDTRRYSVESPLRCVGTGTPFLADPCAKSHSSANLCNKTMSVVSQWAKRLDSHRNKMAGWHTAVLGRLPLCSDLRCLSGLNRSLCHIRSSHRVDNSHGENNFERIGDPNEGAKCRLGR